MGNFINKTNGKTKNKMEGCCPEKQITDPWIMRMEMSRRQRRMEASSEGCQGPKGNVVL